MTEIWKDIEGYEGSYQVSDLGRIKTLPHYVKSKNGYRLISERILKPLFSQRGYLFVILCKDGKRKNFKIHRLVAQVFIPNPNNLPEVNHINECKTDNRVENLEWCTCSYNINWGTRNERVALKNTNGKKSIPVVQFDKNGNFIKEWVSFNQVERELGIWYTNIVRCCKGKIKTSGGFIWKYKSEA